MRTPFSAADRCVQKLLCLLFVQLNTGVCIRKAQPARLRPNLLQCALHHGTAVDLYFLNTRLLHAEHEVLESLHLKYKDHRIDTLEVWRCREKGLWDLRALIHTLRKRSMQTYIYMHNTHNTNTTRYSIT